MKILICTPEYPPFRSSGIGNVVYFLKNELEREKLDCTTCSTMSSDIELCNNLIISKFAHMRSIYISYFWIKVLIYLRKNKNNFDLIWAHDPLPHFLLGIPKEKDIVITFHTIHSFYLGDSKYPKIILIILRILECISLKRLTNRIPIIAVNEKVSDELNILGMEKENIRCIPNGVDTDLFKPSIDKASIRSKLGIPLNKIVFLSVGNLKEQKRPFKLLDLFSSLKNKRDDICLVIVGTGRLYDKLNSYAKELRLNDCFFCGYVDETSEYYACSDYYIITSKYEGLPLTLLEAMSSGLPCIVSEIPNLQIVNEAKCGIVINLENLKEASSNVLEYLDKDDAAKHARNARCFVLENLSWNKIANRYLEVFNSFKL